ncbi:GlcG/HbpS family heme-binding protein [Nocardia sp. NPDC004722]
MSRHNVSWFMVVAATNVDGMTMLSMDIAARLAVAGHKAADGINVAMNIAVVDRAGHLLHFSRREDALLGCIDLAQRKAKTAILFHIPTATLGQMSRPDGPIYGIEWSNGGLISFGGGLPIADDEGRVIGAVGVSGGTAEQDVEVARACVAAL